MKSIKLSQQNKILLLSFLILIAAYAIFSAKPTEKGAKPERIYADTLIPKGMVLIPIELLNADAVAGLMDQYGVVDLYSGPSANVGSKKLASKVKVMRAPLNPNQYAALVPENISGYIMSLSGPFWAVVQNRNAQEATGIADRKAAPVRIEYHKAGG
ncbi:MAG: hypothetical protein A2622_08655 [Bdellovibrionales bacterium RIFCSPHIGHO2_01_FULL_40_29]|nr:MAG: hypothetical protein A2622_08655 [Bdellovibrionales bacterium RIFCSPHIGHO2_01_FULL_40_29]OFZ35558.1 MAG: hypothetical protein A3D17_07890 [Bdellovibrionales bacterium RIFCSPHIGHO2_02_FULL_40_15]